jgi:hypothetical protein
MKMNKFARPVQPVFRGGRLVTLALLLWGSVIPLRAQDIPSRSIEEIYQFDERGDAKIEWRFQLDAGSWAQWKANYGDHPDLLLRMVKYQLAAAVIDDYALDKDDMHRSAVSRFSARALAKYLGGGQFEIPINKNMKLVSGSGLEWIFTGSTIEEGRGILNITYRGKLPEKAQNAHMVNGNDFNHLVYSLQVSPSKPKTLLYSGVVLIAAALVAAVRATRVGGTTATQPPLGPSRPSPTARPPRSP